MPIPSGLVSVDDSSNDTLVLPAGDDMAQPTVSGARISSIAVPSLGRVFLLQGIILGVCAALLLLWGPTSALSALAGGSIALLANGWFAREVFRYSGARRIRQIAAGFYRGEAGKFVLSAALLAALLAGWSEANAAAVLLTFAGMHLVHTACAARMLARYARKPRVS